MWAVAGGCWPRSRLTCWFLSTSRCVRWRQWNELVVLSGRDVGAPARFFGTRWRKRRGLPRHVSLVFHLAVVTKFAVTFALALNVQMILNATRSSLVLSENMSALLQSNDVLHVSGCVVDINREDQPVCDSLSIRIDNTSPVWSSSLVLDTVPTANQAFSPQLEQHPAPGNATYQVDGRCARRVIRVT